MRAIIVIFGLISLSNVHAIRLVQPVPATGPITQNEYVSACRQKGVMLPTKLMKCSEGTEVPIYVSKCDANGKPGQSRTQITEDNYRDFLGSDGKLAACDNPAQLGTTNQCAVGSRIQVVPTGDPNTTCVLFCRKYTLPGEAPKDAYQDINMICHEAVEGNTCFFNSPVGVDVLGEKIAPPHDGESRWLPPSVTASNNCMNCHDNDPFILTPHTEAAGVIPSEKRDLFGPYRAVAAREAFSGDSFQLKYELKNNDVSSCTECHRVGYPSSCGHGSNIFQQSIHGATPPEYASADMNKAYCPRMSVPTMPEGGHVSEEQLAKAEAKIRACCASLQINGPMGNPDCKWAPINRDSDSYSKMHYHQLQVWKREAKYLQWRVQESVNGFIEGVRSKFDPSGGQNQTEHAPQGTFR